MTGVPNLAFDFFGLMEIPTFILCNPNSIPIFAMGGISERTYSARFNSISEISFRADEYVDGIYMPYYYYIVNRRLVKVEGIGIFMITDVAETDNGIEKYKEVTCQSLEIELMSRKMTGFVSGSGIFDETGKQISDEAVPVTLQELYNEISGSLAGWRIVGEDGEDYDFPYPDKRRSFDISDSTFYNFLMVDVEEAYGCIFDFNTEEKRIEVYASEEALSETSIYISHNNLIKEIVIEEVTDQLATCLYVVGGGNLPINWVNPLGNNNIYNFEYFKTSTGGVYDWMSSDLVGALNAWNEKFTTASPIYTENIMLYIEHADVQTTKGYELDGVSGSWLYWVTIYSGCLAAGRVPTEPEMIVIEDLIEELETSASALRDEIDDLQEEMDTYLDEAHEISESLSLDNLDNFSLTQQSDLQPFIIQSSYVNDNIIVSDVMTSACILERQQQLYYQGVNVLNKMAFPKYTFEVDSVSFLNIPEFAKFKEQLSLGSSIFVEIKEGVTGSAILLGIDMNFDNPDDFKLIFGSRLRLDTELFQFNDLLGKAISAGTSNRLYSETWNNWSNTYKSGVTNLMTGFNMIGKDSAEGIEIKPSSINLVTSNLLWNGVPLSTGYATTGSTGGLTNIKITLFSGGVSEKMYEPNAYGLNAAITDSEEGDVIFLPDVDIEGDFSLPVGVDLVGVSSQKSIIRGTITIENSCLLENLSIIKQDETDEEIKAVIVQESIPAEDYVSSIKGCEIRCYQCGNGTAHAVYIADENVDLVVENSTIIADSYGGNGYAFSNNDGYCKVYHSQYYAKTEVFHDL